MITQPSKRAAILLAGIAALAGVAQVKAQTTSWLGDGGTNAWSDPLNWTAGAPSVTNVDLLFGTAFAASPAGTNSLTANNDLVGFTGHRITFESVAANPAFTLTGNALTLAFAVNAPQIVNNSAALQNFNLAGALNFDGGAGGFADINAVNGDLGFSATTPLALVGTTELRFASAASRTTTVNGIISGSGGVTKTGDGTLVLAGANTFSGPLNVKAGALSVATVNLASTAGPLGNSATAVTLGDTGSTGTFRFTGATGATTKQFALATGGTGAFEVTTAANTLTLAGIVSGSGALLKTGPGTLSLNAANTFSGGVTISNGTLNLTGANVGSLGTGTVTLGDANTGANNVTLFHQISANASSATNIVVSANGTGLAQIKWSQDWFGVAGQTAGTANDLKFTLNRAVNFQSTAAGKQITPFVTGPGAGAGNVSVRIDGGTQVTLTAAVNSTNTGVLRSDFVGNVLVTGNTKLQTQNRAYQVNAPEFLNGVIPDSSTVIVDAGSLWQLHHGAETVAFISGAGTVQVGTGTPGNALTLSGSATTPTTTPTTLGTATFSGTLGTVEGGLTKTGTGTQEFSGTGITYNTATTLNDGTLRLTNTTGFNSNIAFAAANSPTLQLNAPAAADTWTFSKQLTGGSVGAKIEKIGAGVVTLAPAAGSTFLGNVTGGLTVTAGTLNLSTSLGNAPGVTVGAGARFAGSVPVGPVAVAATGNIEGGIGGVGTLTMDSLSFAGAGSIFGSISATNPSLVVTGALTTGGGANSITLNITGALPTVNGTYHLLQYGSFAGTAANFKFASPVRSLGIQNNGNFIDINLDSSLFPIWTGAGGSEWSSNTLPTKNWKLSSNGSGTDFLAVDNVLFNDTAANRNVLVSTTNVNPGNITFNNSAANPYTLGGTMDIVSGALLKQGAGTLTINGNFTFGGGSTLSAGKVSIASETALGTGVRTFDGGTLTYTGANATWTRNSVVNATNGTLEVADAGATLIHNGTLTGAGILTKTGPGALQLGAGTHTGGLNIATGLLKIDSTSGPVNLNGQLTGPGTIEYYGQNPTTIGGTVANDFTGDLNLYGRNLFLNKPAGSNNAVTGNIIIRTGFWPVHGLTISADEQIANTSTLTFAQTADPYDFRLNGKTETIAGIVSTTPASYMAIIENAGYEGGNDAGITTNGKLIVSGSGTYNYPGQLRDRNGGTSGVLEFSKQGTGTQRLVGDSITYTGATTVTGGKLTLVNTINFASSSTTVTTPGTVELARETSDWTFSKSITGTGGLKISSDLPAGVVTVSATSDYSGATEVVSGTMNLTGTLSASAVTVDSLAALRGTGHVGKLLTLSIGATLAPGATGGTLFADAGLTLQSGSSLLFDLSGNNQTIGLNLNDSVTVTGNLVLDGTLSLNGTFGGSFTAAANGTKWRLFDYSGSLTNNIIDLGTMPALGPNLSFAIDTSTPNQVNLAVVPEPTSVLALLGGLGVLAGLRRRRS